MEEEYKGQLPTTSDKTLQKCLMCGSKTKMDKNNLFGKRLGVSRPDQLGQ
jgi:hypothetical protein